MYMIINGKGSSNWLWSNGYSVSISMQLLVLNKTSLLRWYSVSLFFWSLPWFCFKFVLFMYNFTDCMLC